MKQKSKTNHRFDLWFDIRSSRELNTTTYESQQRGEWSALELVSKSVGTCRVMRMRESFIYLSFFDRFIVRLGEKLFSRQEWQTCNEAWLWIGPVDSLLSLALVIDVERIYVMAQALHGSVCCANALSLSQGNVSGARSNTSGSSCCMHRCMSARQWGYPDNVLVG